MYKYYLKYFYYISMLTIEITALMVSQIMSDVEIKLRARLRPRIKLIWACSDLYWIAHSR